MKETTFLKGCTAVKGKIKVVPSPYIQKKSKQRVRQKENAWGKQHHYRNHKRCIRTSVEELEKLLEECPTGLSQWLSDQHAALPLGKYSQGLRRILASHSLVLAAESLMRMVSPQWRKTDILLTCPEICTQAPFRPPKLFQEGGSFFFSH